MCASLPMESLPMVLLGIRAALKEDPGCSIAELVYGHPYVYLVWRPTPLLQPKGAGLQTNIYQPEGNSFLHVQQSLYLTLCILYVTHL